MHIRQPVLNLLVIAIGANLVWLGSGEDVECDVFLAPSSIPNGGLGVYAAKSIEKGEKILSDDMAIHFIDRYQQDQLRLKHEKQSGKAKNDTWALGWYALDSHWTMGSFEAKQVESLPYSLSMLANSHSVLHNVEMMPPSVDPAVNDIHAGATSSYHGLYAQATRDIEAGEELFSSMDPKRVENDPSLQNYPLESDYEKALTILKNFKILVPNLESKEADLLWKLLRMSNTKWSDEKQKLVELKKPLHELQKEHKDNRVLSKVKSLSRGNLASKKASNMWKFLKSITPNEKLQKVLPRKVENIQKALEVGVPKASLPNRVRDISWLEQHGICISNLKPGSSNIPHAGRGAFATQDLAQDAIISAVPVAPFDRSLVQMYKNIGAHVWKKGFQQVLNYAFGHEQSSVLFLPYSPVIPYLNHDSNPNAELRWSKLNNHSILELPASELFSQSSHSGLVMELVATRSIEQNEEVTISYGNAWQRSWEDFLANEGPKERTPGFQSAPELNQQKAHLFTEEELRHNSHITYPSNVQLMCFTCKNHCSRQISERNP